jgi:hypothetical protein
MGEKSLTLASGLKEFPLEILDMAESLEVLDMTNNQLSTLPDRFGKLKKLKILFLSNNQFKVLPKVLRECPNLTMIGFRNNQIESIPEDGLPLKLQWLILTDNHIKTLPNSIGDLLYLQKFMLSGNQITTLPKTLLKCHSLELLRLASNQLDHLPSWLLTLPKLSWFAYAGNPFCKKHPSCETPLSECSWNQLKIKEPLGEGASGEIFKAFESTYGEVAIKIFKGEMTSDGLPKEEMDINISLGHHNHLVDVLAKVSDHPEGKEVLVLELIPSNYSNLGLPPTLESCTRDVYPKELKYTLSQTIKLLIAMASAGEHLHTHGIMHGDFYAHNIMIDNEANSLLVDFGAASYYEPNKNSMREALERLEVRAFGCLVEEMLLLSSDDDRDREKRETLVRLKRSALNENTFLRPLFKTILEDLNAIES